MTTNDHGLSMPIEELRARYEAERNKRLRPEGEGQYREIKGDEDFDRDPYCEPLVREPIVEETDAVIVGAGFGGMLTAVGLTKEGVRNFRMIDKAGDFGGTWYWNRYPGCMCDVESYTYLPLLEETGYMPTERYASAEEIFGYCQLIGRQFDLYPHALFQTEVVDAVWDESADRWQITTNRGDKLSARFVVTAGGILHKAKLPRIEGIETFEGKKFHTARWDYDYTGGSCTQPLDKLADKRVAIIGTGATAVQSVPKLAASAKELYVFQRTPSAVGVRDNRPTDEAWFREMASKPGWQWERIVNFTQSVTGNQPEVDLVQDGWTDVMWVNTSAGAPGTPEALELEIEDFKLMDRLRARVDEVIGDPALAEKLKPWYAKTCKRICFHDDYLPAFNRPNVHLVDTEGRGVDRITPNGVMVDGTEYEVDCIIFASGFDLGRETYQALEFDPVGRSGLKLSERWKNGAYTIHGILSAEFPNLMQVSIVQGAFGTNHVHFLTYAGRHIAWTIAHCLAEDVATIEPTAEAEEEWLMKLYGTVPAGAQAYTASCTPGYMNKEQEEMSPAAARNLLWMGSCVGYGNQLEEWRKSNLPGAKVVKAGSRG
jgi:cation diffusion facilitator CzcD-associated flavoprotein CzcO